MSTQIQQQQVQGLVSAISGISANTQNLVTTGATLLDKIAATGYSLDAEIDAVSGILIATGSALSASIVNNTYNLNLTGAALYSDITGVAGNLVTSGANLTETIVATGALLTTNLIATGGYLTETIVATGALLTTNLIATGGYLSDRLIATGSGLSDRLIATGSGLSDRLIATGAVMDQFDERLITTGAVLETGDAVLSGNIEVTGAMLQSQIDGMGADPGSAAYANYSLASDFRLNDYALQTALTGISSGVLQEASSVCYNTSGHTYLVLCPKPTGYPLIKEIRFGGTNLSGCYGAGCGGIGDDGTDLVRTTSYIVPVGYEDVEGITYVTGSKFALCSEYKGALSSDAILLFDYIGSTGLGSTNNVVTGVISSGDFTVYEVDYPWADPKVNNIGLEGISYNPKSGVFYGAFEGDSSNGWKVMEITLGEEPIPPAVGSTTSVELFSRSILSEVDRLSDVYYDPNSNHFFLTDHGHVNATVAGPADRSRVWEVGLTGNLIDYVDLKTVGGRRNLAEGGAYPNYNQLEGITFSPDGGRMVVVGETAYTGSDIGYYTISSSATSGVYIFPAMRSVAKEVVLEPGYKQLTQDQHGTYVHFSSSTNIYLPYPSFSGEWDGFKCDIFNSNTSLAGATVTVLPEAPGTFIGVGVTGGLWETSLKTPQHRWLKVWCMNGQWYGAGDHAVGADAN
jgi:hypothetical protein